MKIHSFVNKSPEDIVSFYKNERLDVRHEYSILIDFLSFSQWIKGYPRAIVINQNLDPEIDVLSPGSVFNDIFLLPDLFVDLMAFDEMITNLKFAKTINSMWAKKINEINNYCKSIPHLAAKELACELDIVLNQKNLPSDPLSFRLSLPEPVNYSYLKNIYLDSNRFIAQTTVIEMYALSRMFTSDEFFLFDGKLYSKYEYGMNTMDEFLSEKISDDFIKTVSSSTEIVSALARIDDQRKQIETSIQKNKDLDFFENIAYKLRFDDPNKEHLFNNLNQPISSELRNDLRKLFEYMQIKGKVNSEFRYVLSFTDLNTQRQILDSVNESRKSKGLNMLTECDDLLNDSVLAEELLYFV